MSRDKLAALARAAVTLVAGAALLYAIGRYLGWWVVGAIAVAGIGAAWWSVRQLPSRMMPW